MTGRPLWLDRAMRAVSDLGELLTRAAAATPDKVALVEADGRRLTWAGLDDAASRLAAGLGDIGVIAGRRVMIASANRIEFVVAYLGVLRAQAVAVPVNPRASVLDLARMIADSGSRVVLADPVAIGAARPAVAMAAAARAGDVTEIEPELATRAHRPRLVTIGVGPLAGELTYDELVAAEPRPVPPLPDPDKLAALLYTAGTSGRPRAAMLTHRAFLANIEQVAAVEPPMMHGDDVVLGMLPLFHVYGLNAVLGGVLRHRARLVLQDGFDAHGTLDLIEDEAVSVLPVAPPVFAHWLPVEALREALGPVRLVLSGSAQLPAEVIERFTALTGLSVHQGYGLTEAAPVVTTTLRGGRAGSLGVPLAGVEIRAVDDVGRPAEGADPGEIQIRGANLFSGYWPDGADGPGGDGWWPTGDVGYVDDDGALFLVDRLQELIGVSGFQVYPQEVEGVIREVAGVRDAAVIGVPDDATGAAVVAYVVPAGDVPDLAERVAAECAERLAGFKRPSRIEVVDSLPRTATGRVQKGRLRGIERRRALGLVE